MAEIVIAAYRPKAGKQKELEKIVREHVPQLRKLEMVTDREPVIMRAEDGTILEVFEWRSKEAVERAHEHPAVAKIWEDFGKVCDYVPLNSLAESAKPFTHYKPIN